MTTNDNDNADDDDIKWWSHQTVDSSSGVLVDLLLLVAFLCLEGTWARRQRVCITRRLWWYVTCPVLCCPVLSCPVLSCPVLWWITWLIPMFDVSRRCAVMCSEVMLPMPLILFWTRNESHWGNDSYKLRIIWTHAKRNWRTVLGEANDSSFSTIPASERHTGRLRRRNPKNICHLFYYLHKLTIIFGFSCQDSPNAVFPCIHHTGVRTAYQRVSQGGIRRELFSL